MILIWYLDILLDLDLLVDTVAEGLGDLDVDLIKGFISNHKYKLICCPRKSKPWFYCLRSRKLKKKTPNRYWYELKVKLIWSITGFNHGSWIGCSPWPFPVPGPGISSDPRFCVHLLAIRVHFWCGVVVQWWGGVDKPLEIIRRHYRLNIYHNWYISYMLFTIKI